MSHTPLCQSALPMHLLIPISATRVLQVGLDVQLLADMQQSIAALEPPAAPKNTGTQPTEDALYQVRRGRVALQAVLSALTSAPCPLAVLAAASELAYKNRMLFLTVAQAFKRAMDLLIVDLERNIKLLGTPERAQVG